MDGALDATTRVVASETRVVSPRETSIAGEIDARRPRRFVETISDRIREFRSQFDPPDRRPEVARLHLDSTPAVRPSSTDGNRIEPGFRRGDETRAGNDERERYSRTNVDGAVARPPVKSVSRN